MRLTDAEIRQIRDACEKATPGEWKVLEREWDCVPTFSDWLLFLEGHDPYIEDFGILENEADAELACLAHSLLPRLLDEVTELRQERAAIEYAAHMPADYEHGLPSWINQRLYGRLLEMTDKDGGPIRRTEDVEELRRLRQENRRLLVLGAYQGRAFKPCEWAQMLDAMGIPAHATSSIHGDRWAALEAWQQSVVAQGRALITGKEASGG